MAPLLAFFSPGPMELMIIGGIFLLLFGNRLPSVMRSLGKGIVEFKKGVNGIEDDVESSGKSSERIVQDGSGSSKDKETAAP